MRKPDESVPDYIERLNRTSGRLILASAAINILAMLLVIASKVSG